MRWLLVPLLFFAAAACDDARSDSQNVTPPATECIPMPAECPQALECEVATVTAEDGTVSRVCGGTACCQSFCNLNGCGTCCATAP